MITSATDPTRSGAVIPWKAAWGAMMVVSIFCLLSGLAKAADDSGLSLVIRGPTNVVKVGDEIPISFTISNRGTEDFSYEDWTYDWTHQMEEYHLASKTSSGESVPSPHEFEPAYDPGGIISTAVLHPGESFTKIIPLNRSVLITAPGRYEIVGNYQANRISNKPGAQAASAPLYIEILPRSEEEMNDYIKGLVNQVPPRLAASATNVDAVDWTLWDRWERSLTKLMYTCRPEFVPIMLGALYDTNRPIIMGKDWLPMKALSCYAPHNDQTRKMILDWVAMHGLNWSVMDLFSEYGMKRSEMKPVIERALAETNIDDWGFGAILADSEYCDDAFNPRLIAIARDITAPVDARSFAMEAVAANRSEAGIKTLKALLDDANVYNSADLARAIAYGYGSPHGYPKTPASRHLQPADFDFKEVRPLIERLIASTNVVNDEMNREAGLDLAAVFDDDSLTPKLVALAGSSQHFAKEAAIRALAFNRTEEGLKTLKALLHDPDQWVVSETEQAIRDAYAKRGATRGRPLQPGDFDAKFQQTVVPPAN